MDFITCFLFFLLSLIYSTIVAFVLSYLFRCECRGKCSKPPNRDTSIFPHINLLDEAGYSPLHYASGEGNRALCRRLIRAGADVNLFSSSGESPLALAVMSNDTDLIRYLLRLGARPNPANNEHNSLLAYSCRSGLSDLAECAILSGANVNGEYLPGCSLLDAACLENCPGVVEALLCHGADPNQSNLFSDFVLEEGRGPVISGLLRSYGCDLNGVDRHGDTALHKAILENRPHEVTILLELGASINITNNHGMTAFQAAIHVSNLDLSSLLWLVASAELEGRPRPHFLEHHVEEEDEWWE